MATYESIYNSMMGIRTNEPTTWYQGAFQPYNVNYNTPQAIQSPTPQSKADYSNALFGLSPVGQTITTGYGMITTRGRHIVDVKRIGDIREKDDGKILVNLVLMVADTALGGTYDLLWCRVNSEFIIKRGDTGANNSTDFWSGMNAGNWSWGTGGGGGASGATDGNIGATNYRYYDGSQTAIDPLIAQYFSAEDQTAWPGFAYIVFEDFDIAPFGNQIPDFDFQISSDVSSSGATVTITDVTFGAYPEDVYAFTAAPDFTKQVEYVFASNSGSTLGWIVTIDIKTKAEIRRVPLYRDDGQQYFDGGWIVALEGSEYAVCAMRSHYTVPSTFDAYDLALINVNTGECKILPHVWTNGDTYEVFPSRAVKFPVGGSDKYVIVCGVWYGDPGSVGCASPFVMVDTTAGTIEYIYHPATNDIVGANLDLWSFDFGPVIDDQLVIFACYSSAAYFASQQQRNKDPIYRYLVSETGVTGDILWDPGSYVNRPISVAYNPLNAQVVCKTWDEKLLSIKSDGTVLVINSDTSTFTGYYYPIQPYYGSQWWFCTHGWRDSYGIQCRNTPGFVVASDGSSPSGWYRVNLTTGDIEDVLSDKTDAYVSPDYSSPAAWMAIDDVEGWTAGEYTVPFDTIWSGSLEVWEVGNVTPNLIDLEDIITALMIYNGQVSAGDLSFTNFPGNECYGVKYEEDTSISDAVQTVIEPFDISKVESDGKVKFRYPRRDGAYAIDLTLSDAQIVDQGEFTIVKNISPEETSLKEVAISYFDKTNYGERGDQPFRRPNTIYDVTKSVQKRSFNLPLYMNPAQAQKLAATMVYRSVYDLEIYTLIVGPAYSYLEPGDNIEFTFNNATVSGQIKRATLRADYSQELTVHQYMQTIDATYDGVQRYVTDYVPDVFTTRFQYLGIPLISEFDDKGGASLVEYAILTGTNVGNFVGGELYEESASATAYQTSDGQYWDKIGSSINSPPIGVISAISGVPSQPFRTDRENTIDVLISNGDSSVLETITDQQLAGNQNLAVIGVEGRWVVIAFRDVSLSGSTATLSNIRFGLKGTEVYLNQLQVGDSFVFIDNYYPIKFTNSLAELNTANKYKAKTSSFALDSVSTYSKTSAGVAETPFAPVNLNAEWHGADILISWQWRSRIDLLSILTGPADTVHGEDSLSFEIDILDTQSGGTVIRTLTANDDNVLYDATDIATDFSPSPAELTFRVYMISAVVDRGHEAEATITL